MSKVFLKGRLTQVNLAVQKCFQSFVVGGYLQYVIKYVALRSVK